jgi:hypothetical protein
VKPNNLILSRLEGGGGLEEPPSLPPLRNACAPAGGRLRRSEIKLLMFSSYYMQLMAPGGQCSSPYPRHPRAARAYGQTSELRQA